MTDVTECANAIDLEGLMGHMGDDTSFLSELFSIFRDYYPEQMAGLRVAIAEGDSSAVRETAHQIKGAVSNFYARTAFKAAQDLENTARDNRLNNAEDLAERLEKEIERMNIALSELCNQ